MQKRLNEKKSSTHKWAFLVLLLLIVFFLLFLFLRHHVIGITVDRSSVQMDTSVVNLPDTVVIIKDTTEVVDTVSPVGMQASVDTTKSAMKPVKKQKPVLKKDTLHTEAIKDTTSQDSAIVNKDSSALVDSVFDKCKEDSSALWVYPDPSGGLHHQSISVTFKSNRPCDIQYRFKNDLGWLTYGGEPVQVKNTSTLIFEAVDSCGRIMEERSEFYEIELENKNNPCISGMEYVKIGNLGFCIDRYEWPNRKGVIPRSYVSVYQAMDSCYSAGKRLCTAEEWLIACAGPYSWKYPYGQIYEKYACSTHDTSITVSGSRPECRGYYGNFDMSGSLLEWTSTKAIENHQFNYVMGGFWESGPQSGCSDKRYSYFPENKHNPVGFRCCSDLPEQKDYRPGN